MSAQLMPSPLSAAGVSGVDAPPIYKLGDTVHWHVDLTPAYPRGVLCTRVQARLFPSIPDEEVSKSRRTSQTSGRASGFDGEGYEAKSSFVNPVEMGIIVAESNPAPLAVEVGREYKVAFTLTSDQLSLWSGVSALASAVQYRVALECVPVSRDGVSATPVSVNEQIPKPQSYLQSVNADDEEEIDEDDDGQDDAFDQGLVLALSEAFKVKRSPSGSFSYLSSKIKAAATKTFYRKPAPASSAYLVDITPLDNLQGEAVQCPISKKRPDLPVRIDDIIYDRDALVKYLEAKDTSKAICLRRNVLDNVCVDAQHYYKLQKYAEAELESVLSDRACTRAQALAEVNLQTETLLAVDMGLNGDSLRFADVLVRNAAAPALSRLQTILRKVGRASVRGMRFIVPVQTVAQRAVTTATVVLVLSLMQVGVCLVPPLRSHAHSVVLGGGLLASGHADFIKKVVSKLTVFVLLHAADSALKAMETHDMFDDADIEKILTDFIAALRRLNKPVFSSTARRTSITGPMTSPFEADQYGSSSIRD